MARIVEGSHSFTHCPCIYPQMEWTIPAFSFPAEADSHLTTPDGWRAELAYAPWWCVNNLSRTATWWLSQLLAVQTITPHWAAEVQGLWVLKLWFLGPRQATTVTTKSAVVMVIVVVGCCCCLPRVGFWLVTVLVSPLRFLARHHKRWQIWYSVTHYVVIVCLSRSSNLCWILGIFGAFLKSFLFIFGCQNYCSWLPDKAVFTVTCNVSIWSESVNSFSTVHLFLSSRMSKEFGWVGD